MPPALLVMRQRIMRVTATVLAAGMATLAVVLPVSVPTITWLDVLTLLAAASVHAVAAMTVGRSWEPGGAACAAYLTAVVLLAGAGILASATPGSDAFWFLLIPIGLAALTMRPRAHGAITGMALLVYALAMTAGPGFELEWAVPRMVAGTIFAAVMGGLAHRLEQAIVAADGARGKLQEQFVELEQANLRLAELDRAKDAFVATVSHELRTPLTTVIGVSDTLELHWERMTAQQRETMVAQLGRNARGIESITSTMLDLARIERGGFVPAREAVDLAAVVEDAVLRLEPQLQSHDVRVEMADGARIASDAGLLSRVIDNLLLNAARHTPADTAIRVRVTAANEGTRLEVADGGPGMAPQQLARLGEWFYRGDAPGLHGAEGVGIGLALVNDILAALGTELEVDSEHGRGSSFSFVLPDGAAASA